MYMKQGTSKGRQEITTIPIRKATRDRLRELGRMNDTYDDLIERLMDVYEKGGKK